MNASPFSILIKSTLSAEWTDKNPANALSVLTISVDNEDAINGDMAQGLLNAIIKNGQGTLLPSTGGIGTTIFYLIGGIMILGAFVTFIVRRKMSANK